MFSPNHLGRVSQMEDSMTQRVLSAVMVLIFAYLTIIGVRDLLDDLPSGGRTGGPVQILLDIFCVVVCVGWIAAFMCFWLASKKSNTSSGPLPRQWVG
jgi:succinate dehydrogenase hydrophobic anchor subunit